MPPLGTSLFERLARMLARKLILDVEDNVLLGQGLARKDNPNYWATLLKGPGKIRYLIRTADHVIAASPFFAGTCTQLNERRAATYISSSVDTDRFLRVNAYSGTENLTIGITSVSKRRPND